MAVLTLQTVNSMETRELSHIKALYDKFPREFLIGETGLNADDIDTRWQNELRISIQAYLHMGATVTLWGAGTDGFSTNYDYRLYTLSNDANGPISSIRPAAIVGEEFLPTYSGKLGICWSALEQGHNPYNPTKDNNIVTQLASRGWRTVRISFHWNRLQPTLNGGFDTTYYNRLKSTIELFRAKGFTRVIICMHNYGCHSSSRDPARAIGTGAVPESAFHNIWKRIHEDAFLGDPTIEYDTMNEPVMITGGASAWSNMAQNLKNFLATEGVTNRLWYESWNWAGVQDAPSLPGNSPVDSVHDYKDVNNSGTMTTGFDSQNGTAAGQGFAASQSFSFDNAGITTTPPPTETGTVITSTNVVEARAMKLAKNFVTWLNGKKGLVGETGIPWQFSNSTPIDSTDRAKWLSLGNKMYAIWNDNDIDVTMWGGGKSSGFKLWGSYQFTAWEEGGSPFTARWNSALYTNSNNYESINYTTTEYLRGLNISGAEFGFAPAGDGGAGNRHSADNLTADWVDTYGSGYPTATEYQYFNNIGLKLVRLPFRMEKLFPTLNSTTFNAAELAGLKASIDAAAAYPDIKIIVDIHNYGAFLTGATSPYTTNRLGQGWTVNAYKAQVLALVNEIKAKSNFYAIDLMNEPSQIYTTGTSSAQKGATWEGYTNTVISHLRSNAYVGKICVPGADWSGAGVIAEFHPNGPWNNDANIIWECHHYPDKDANGDVPGSETWAVMEQSMSGEPQQSYTIRFTAAPTPPLAPSGLTATTSSTNRMTLAWVDNAISEENYKVQRKIGPTGSWQTIATLPPSSTAYADQGLTPVTTYYYRVVASNSAGDSGFSNEAYNTTRATGRVAVGELTLRPIFARRG